MHNTCRSNPNQALAGAVSGLDVDERHMQPIKKRPRIIGVTNGSTKTLVVRKRGKLQRLAEMPLDILYEIFSHLQPSDLLRIARTTKAVRAILMTKASISVWKAARANLPDFPDCPPDLNEPQYANLAFGSNCHYCLAQGASTIIWEYRVRCCQSCIRQKFARFDNLLARNTNGPVPLELLCALPIFPIPGNKGRRSSDAYGLDDYKRLLEQYSHIQNDADKVRRLIDDTKQATARKCQNASVYASWHEAFKDSRGNVLQDTRLRRRHGILAKLEALGWAKELSQLTLGNQRILFSHPFVKQSTDLTDRAWAKMQQIIIDLMESFRSERLEHDRKMEIQRRRTLFTKVVSEYTQSRSVFEIVPRAADIYFMDSAKAFRTMVEDVPLGEVDPEIFDMNGLNQLQDLMPQLSAEWETSKTSELLKLMWNGEETNMPGKEVLDLATTFFVCPHCRRPISYPRILCHSCMYWFPKFDGYNEEYMAQENDPYIALGSCVWDGGKFISNEGYTAGAREIIEISGCDPNTLTTRDMDEIDPMFECTRCAIPAEGRRLLMNWRCAIEHYPTHLDRNIVLLEGADADAARKGVLDAQSNSRNFICKRCSLRYKYSRSALKTHLLEEHDIQGDLTPENYGLHIDANRATSFISLGKDIMGFEYLGFDYLYISDDGSDWWGLL